MKTFLKDYKAWLMNAVKYGIPDVMCCKVAAQEIKNAIYIKINKVPIEEMEKKTKVKDRFNEDP